jgi:hypothetical protein
MTLQVENNKELRLYLLGDLTGEAQERVERRLLTEPDFLEELLLGEEELVDDYVGDELSADERLKFERHFLSTPERRRQLSFALALGRYVSNSAAEVGGESARVQDSPAPRRVGWFRAFRGGRPWAPAALALAAVGLIAVALSLSGLFTSSPKTFATLTLNPGGASRSGDAQASAISVPIKEDALRVYLTLPEGAPPAARYRVELESDKGKVESLNAEGQEARSVTVVIPASRLARGQYVLRLFATGADGKEQRVQGGSYLFTAR